MPLCAPQTLRVRKTRCTGGASLVQRRIGWLLLAFLLGTVKQRATDRVQHQHGSCSVCGSPSQAMCSVVLPSCGVVVRKARERRLSGRRGTAINEISRRISSQFPARARWGTAQEALFMRALSCSCMSPPAVSTPSTSEAFPLYAAAWSPDMAGRNECVLQAPGGCGRRGQFQSVARGEELLPPATRDLHFSTTHEGARASSFHFPAALSSLIMQTSSVARAAVRGVASTRRQSRLQVRSSTRIRGPFRSH